LQEFAVLTPENTVYKLIGPVLVQQDQAEAKSTVDTRLDFIRNEMSGFLSFALPPTIDISILKTESRRTDKRHRRKAREEEGGGELKDST